MGLGKTIQIISFLSVLFNKYDIYPFLLCVPNSTATNWVREFEKWAPEMVVAPFWGGQKSQRLSAKYELFKGGEKKSLKCHVIITTYQSVMDTSALMLQFFPVLIIDESQRLKNDESLLFKKLNQYKVDHKILLTGTPLQNNLRELFNIMHFIQPKLFKGIQADEYEDMSPELIEELHNRLRPFFLRRTKEEVLKQLPPKFEIIVPLSMSPVQKEAYKSALGNNIHELLSDMQVSKVKRQKGLSSVLMNLRKILNHPFLIDGVEVTQPDEESTIREMISACEKLRVFHIMLPKLRAKGHRMLIFSTMTRSLDVLEDYLTYQDVRYCRLDGSCSERDRVRSMDSFNAPNSEIDVFLLSTRAGGVGINLATADTIIFWDSDYNPYADAQAIGRAHRIGQTRMVLTFRFMTRLSVEEKILQIGKKKMALEHVVVERMAQEENKIEDIQSILKYGAKNLFDNDDSADIHYDEKKIDALIEREQYRATAEEQKQKEIDDVEKNGEEGMNFSFAKVWKSNGDTEEIQVDGKEEENDDFWTKFLAQKQQEAQKKKEQKEQESLNMGRGLRKRKKPGNYYEKGQKNTNSGSSVDGDFKLDDNNQDSMSDDSENDRDSFVDEIELGMRKLYSNKIMNGTAANQTPNQVSIGAPKHKAKPLFTPLTHLAMVPQHSYISSQEAVRQFDSLPQAKRDEFAKLFEQSFTNSSLRSQLYQYSADMKFKNRADLVQTEVQRIGNDQDSSYQPLTFHAQTLKELNERHDTIIKNMTVADKDEWEVQRKHDQGLLSKFEERWRSAHSTKAPANTLPQAPRAPQLPQLPQKPPPLPQVLLTGAPGGSSNRNKQATFQNENLKQQLAPHLQQQLLRFQKQVAPATPSVSQQPHTAQQQILQYMKPQPSQQQQQQQQPILLQRQPMVGQNNNHASVMFNHLQSNIHNQLNHQLQLNGTNQQVNVDADLIRTLHSQLNNQMQELKLYPGATPSYPPPGQYENVDLLYHHIKRNEITLHQFRQLNHLNGNPQLQYNNIRPYFPQYQSGPQPQQNNGPQNGHHPTN